MQTDLISLKVTQFAGTRPKVTTKFLKDLRGGSFCKTHPSNFKENEIGLKREKNIFSGDLSWLQRLGEGQALNS